MTKKEALDWLISRKEHYEMDDNCQELAEAIGIGIDAIKHEIKNKPSISEDGTLTINVEDGSKVGRVLVSGNNHFGGLYYPDQELKTGHCKDCKHFRELPHHTETLGRCTLHDLRFYPKGDWYCADFEPREARIKNEAN